MRKIIDVAAVKRHRGSTVAWVQFHENVGAYIKLNRKDLSMALNLAGLEPDDPTRATLSDIGTLYFPPPLA